jgi:hypothetical protein
VLVARLGLGFDVILIAAALLLARGRCEPVMKSEVREHQAETPRGPGGL